MRHGNPCPTSWKGANVPHSDLKILFNWAAATAMAQGETEVCEC
jgi:hypothetical protein